MSFRRFLIVLSVFGVALAMATKSHAGPSEVAAIKTEQQPAMMVIGISTRTTNKAEAQGDGEIPKLWMRLFQENLMDAIPNRADKNLVAVYADYVSDQGGAFTYTIGALVTSTKDVPAGMVAKQIPAGRYALIPSEKGPLGEVVPQVWKRIWSLTPDQLGGPRAFGVDYEVFGADAADPQNAKIEVHLGLKPVAETPKPASK